MSQKGLNARDVLRLVTQQFSLCSAGQIPYPNFNQRYTMLGKDVSASFIICRTLNVACSAAYGETSGFVKMRHGLVMLFFPVLYDQVQLRVVGINGKFCSAVSIAVQVSEQKVKPVLTK